MSLLDALRSSEVWEAFYQYKCSLICSKQEQSALRAYIDRRAYEAPALALCRAEQLPLPRRAVISKMHSEKKRVVYTYPEPENTCFKLLTWLMLRRYDALFSPGLYSFRPGRTAKDAIRAIRAVPGIRSMYAYKADISNYFNSVDVNRFLPLLQQTLSDDLPLYRCLSALLLEPRVLSRGVPLTEDKGIMAGTPQSSFYANLYLRDLDQHFFEKGIPYARYSDDIILFAASQTELEQYAQELRSVLTEKGLTVNPEKECFYSPERGWTFLGFCCRGGEIDIAPATVEKLKAKMRRKTRALSRWRDRSGHSGQQAAAAFIRVFNRKLLERPLDRDLSWSHWFFSVINTTRSLQAVDRYAQDCLRTLVSGTRTKARYNVRYEDLKALGYQSLVHAYYSFTKPRKAVQGDGSDAPVLLAEDNTEA